KVRRSIEIGLADSKLVTNRGQGLGGRARPEGACAEISLKTDSEDGGAYGREAGRGQRRPILEAEDQVRIEDQAENDDQRRKQRRNEQAQPEPGQPPVEHLDLQRAALVIIDLRR